MEQRLFIVACIMFVFSLLMKNFKKEKTLENPLAFALWHSIFLFLILSCALYIALFVMSGGEGGLFPLDKYLIGEAVILIISLFGFSVAKQGDDKKREKTLKGDLDWCNTVYFAGFVASIVMFFFIQAFKIPSASMRNTLVEGDHLFVNKAVYGFRIPFTNVRFGQMSPIAKGDIIVFKFPAKDDKQLNCGGQTQYGKDFVKRIVGVPGDTIEVKNGRLWVNGEEAPQQPYELYEDVERIDDIENDDPELYQRIWESHQLDSYLGNELRDTFGPVRVPSGSYFVMGDNRDNSCDSRFWGPVPRENIKGKAWFIHWPIKKIGLIK